MMAATATPEVVVAAMPRVRQAALARGPRQALAVWRARQPAVARAARQALAAPQARQATVAQEARQALAVRRAPVAAVEAAPLVVKACVHARSFAPAVPAQNASANAETAPSFALRSPRRCSGVVKLCPIVISSAWVAIRFPMTTFASRRAQHMPVAASAFDV